ncbi:MAG: hypothetical protein JO038_00770 [Alphaproteobacteria bacterium]|nr:hypothetical protein [Alphaproteobacteria bacterium]
MINLFYINLKAALYLTLVYAWAINADDANGGKMTVQTIWPLPNACGVESVGSCSRCVETIVSGNQPAELTAYHLIRQLELPIAWPAQRQLLGFR